MKMKTLLTLLFAAIALQFSAQPTPAPAQSESILITNVTAHLGTGDVIENAAIGFANGKLTFVGASNAAKAADFDTVIDGEGQHAYPGLISPNSTLGLQEIGAVRATRDQYEVGTFRPNVRAIIAYNTESEITPTVRTNGVLVGQITPRGGTLSGSSGIVHFDAWNWEDAAYRVVDGIHLNWPWMHHRHSEHGTVEYRKRKKYDQQKREIERFFTEAKAYCDERPNKTEVKFEAMCGLFTGELRLYVHAWDIKQINEAVHFKRKFDIPHMVIVGGADSHLAADLLRENNVAVMVRRLHSLPRLQEGDMDETYKLPKLLEDEGVLYCLENSGDMEQMGTRNLPFYAGTAAAYGLTYEQAVKAVTLNTAKILGIDKRLGSLEVGKDATLFLSKGDALDMMTNDVTRAYIEGRAIDLDNRQLQLYRKYKAKYDNE